MSDTTDWQAFSVELAENAKRNLDAKDDEIDRLKAQLKETEEKGRVLMDMCRDLRARVTRLSEALQVAVDTPELRGGTWRDMAVAALADGQKGCDGD